MWSTDNTTHWQLTIVVTNTVAVTQNIGGKVSGTSFLKLDSFSLTKLVEKNENKKI